jgi:deoxyribodipyrimidine photo-lyase
LSDEDIHDPWGRGAAPANYAKPLVGHREARDRALKAFKERAAAA